MQTKKSMPVLILCGGRGIRLAGEATYIPKAMVHIGRRPIIWHIMRRFASYGYTTFVLALGIKGEMVRDYFLNYGRYTDDIRICLGNGDVEHVSMHQEDSWNITMVDTGENSNSGARIARCKQYIGTKEFLLTYSDSVANIDIAKLIAVHHKKGKVATVTGVIPPYREQELHVADGLVIGRFDPSKAKPQERYVNGGYMVFSDTIFSYLSLFDECRLEGEVFEKLMSEKQLAVYPHHGFWRWLDTDRDYQYLNSLVNDNKTYWLNE
jgi:glucose-1-phosphate cytidylyltransferase